MGICVNLCFIHMLVGACIERRYVRDKSLPGEKSAVIIPSKIIHDKLQIAECTEEVTHMRTVLW